MKQPAPDLAALARPALAGLAVSVMELLAVAAGARVEGVRPGQWGELAGVSFGMCAALALLTWAVASAVARRWRTAGARMVVVVAGLLPVLVVSGASLTGGRLARDHVLRWPAVIGMAVVVAVVVGLVVRGLGALGTQRRRLRWAAAGILMAAVVGCLAADRFLVPRLYPAFHWLMAGTAWTTAFLAAWIAPWRARVRAVGAVWFMLGCLALVAWPAVLLGGLPAGRVHLLEAHAPITGKWLAVARHLGSGALGGDEHRRAAALARVTTPRPAAVPAFDLLGYDVLLITVDALRYDRVAGSPQRRPAPNLARLAARGATFDRAYTSTPHTSYAIASLMTGKHLRTALAARPDATHRTWAQLLGAAGYDTAAFYPPAVFYVDGEQLASLAANGLGFAHREVGFESAGARVDAVMAHVARVPEDRRVFVWAHFFEPHEPYDAATPDLEGAPPEARYDSEVSVVDAAIGLLVGQFERARPRALVVVTSDHGEEFGEHGGAYHGTTVFDEQVRVPLIVVAAGRVVPRRIGTPVETIDLAPTLTLALGVPPDGRMVGRDLGPLLVSGRDTPHVAVSVAGDEWMLTDGRYKAVCATGARGCRLFDLRADPLERNDVASDHGDVATNLEHQLGERIDAMITRERERDGDGAARVLSRARLLDPTVTSELVPLLGAGDAHVRAAAARLLGEQRYEAVLPVLVRMRADDADAQVRTEAAMAALWLGDRGAAQQVADVYASAAATADQGELALRAALVLALAGDGRGVTTLVAFAQGAGALDARRRALVAAIPHATPREVPALVALLASPSLRVEAAAALGHAGGRPARRALLDALDRETYPLARTAELGALADVDLAACRRWVWPRVETGALPEPVGALVMCDALARPGPAGVMLTSAARARRGDWACDVLGCTPLAAATLVWPGGARVGPVARVHLRVRAREAGLLTVNGVAYPVRAGVSELVVAAAPVLAFGAAPGVRIEAAAMLRPDGAPPPASPASASGP